MLSDPVTIIGNSPGDPPIRFITDYAPGREDTLYILAGKEGEVHAYGLNGGFLFSFGGIGQGPGEFVDPRSVSYGKRGVLVTDHRLTRISLFDSRGSYITSMGTQYNPIDAVMVGDEIVYTTTSYRYPVWRTSFSDPAHHTAVLDMEEGWIQGVPEGQRATTPTIAVCGNQLVVGFPSSGAVAIWSLPFHEGDPILQRVSTSQTDAYWERFRRESTKYEGLPARPRPSPFRYIASWSENAVLLEIRDPQGESRGWSGLILPLSEKGIAGGKRAVTIAPENDHSMRFKRLSADLAACVDFDNSTLRLYRIARSR